MSLVRYNFFHHYLSKCKVDLLIITWFLLIRRRMVPIGLVVMILRRLSRILMQKMVLIRARLKVEISRLSHGVLLILVLTKCMYFVALFSSCRFSCCMELLDIYTYVLLFHHRYTSEFHTLLLSFNSNSLARSICYLICFEILGVLRVYLPKRLATHAMFDQICHVWPHIVCLIHVPCMTTRGMFNHIWHI